jgi:hypothetical protein
MTNGNGKFSWKDSVSLKEYFEAKINNVEEETTLRIKNLERATDLAKVTMDERLARMNEFRDALKDQNQTFLTRAEYENSYKQVIEDIKSLRESRAALEGKASQNAVNISIALGTIGIVMSGISLIVRILGF